MSTNLDDSAAASSTGTPTPATHAADATTSPACRPQRTPLPTGGSSTSRTAEAATTRTPDGTCHHSCTPSPGPTSATLCRASTNERPHEEESPAMTITRSVLDRLRVDPGESAGLVRRNPSWHGGKALAHLSGKGGKKRAEHDLEQSRLEIAREQELLWADDSQSLLLIFQAMDAAGKDGTIGHVMSGVNPQGCEVTSFKQPSAEELDHDFLWRTAKAAPRAGADRHLQPLPLRGGPRRPRPPGVPRQAAAAAGEPGEALLEAALRQHQRLRTPPGPQRDDHRQVLPARLQGGATPPAARPSDRAGQGVEVLGRRRGRAAPLGRVHAGLRRGDHGDVDPLGARGT